MISTNELEDLMSYCYCSDNYHHYNLLGKDILLTDGVKLFVEKVNCFWFINDFLIFMNKWINKDIRETFYSIEFNVSRGRGNVYIKNGSGEILYKKRYICSDVPSGEWKFYYDKVENVLLYYLEY